ncbi:MAG TPA: LytTR family DNA-binding domain-containing protein [Phnomibacter sp.]|nr:LytTR family DNA-binding domain-containing protein [Phnomibacter sp.]
MKACIIDDEKNSREVLELMLAENHPEIMIAGTASNISEALTLVTEVKPDIIFLDIEMPGGTGFDLVRQLQEPLPEIIFCTAYGHYAIKAIECSALAYLLKPVSSTKLAAAIHKAQMKTSALEKKLQIKVLEEQLDPAKEPTRFLLNTTEDTKVIRFDEVLCCVAESNYTRIYLADGTKFTASKTLKEFESILSKHQFFRIHHSYLVNLNYIKRIDKTEGYAVELPHQIKLEVARSKKDELLEKVVSL